MKKIFALVLVFAILSFGSIYAHHEQEPEQGTETETSIY